MRFRAKSERLGAFNFSSKETVREWLSLSVVEEVDSLISLTSATTPDRRRHLLHVAMMSSRNLPIILKLFSILAFA